MDKVKLIMDRTAAGLEKKINLAYDEGYRPEGSFNRTADGRWFMQTMSLPAPSAPGYASDDAPATQVRVKPSRAKSEAKPNKAKKAAKK